MIKAFTAFANLVSQWAGRPAVFFACVVVVVGWALSGPVFGFSDTWQLVINTSTTIVTFLMVFLIQSTQNRDNAAVQAKLDELIKAIPKADNSFIGIEHLTDQELADILEACERTVEERRKTPKPGVEPKALTGRPKPAPRQRPKAAGARQR